MVISVRMTEQDDETTYTLDEIIDSLEDEGQHLSDVVYGGTNAEEGCTYSKGYLKRQAIYICLSCTNVSESPAGLCYNCSYTCHKGHDILELYTKRNFRCDCGNSKFSEIKCSLEPNKESLNNFNKYGQNFQGLFCTCNRPYPDDEIDEDMFQCIVCEDWYHQSHLDPKPEGEFDEMTCSMCVAKYEFLKVYHHIIQNQKKSEQTLDDHVDVINADEKDSSSVNKSDHPDVKRIRLDDSACQLKLNAEFTKNGHEIEHKCLYWPKYWRQDYLCSCEECKKMYETLGVSFLLDPEDCLSDYAEKGSRCLKQVTEGEFQDFNNMLQTLPHDAACEVAYKITEFKKDLENFFVSLKNREGPIKAEDVQKFFEDRKRKQTD